MRGEGPGSSESKPLEFLRFRRLVIFVASSPTLPPPFAGGYRRVDCLHHAFHFALGVHPPVCIFSIDYNNTATMVINPHKLGVHKVLQHIPLNKVFDAPAKARLAKAVNIADLRLCAKQRAHKVSFKIVCGLVCGHALPGTWAYHVLRLRL